MSRLLWLLHPRDTIGGAWKHLRAWGRDAPRFIGANRVPLTVLVILVAAVGAGVWSLTHFWDWLQADQVNGVVGKESGSTTVRNIGFVVAGLIALPFAFWRSWVAQRQADTAQQSLLNERYQQGAEMLGSDALAVRLGGIYALERLAEEHAEQYHAQIMQVFCAFARHVTAARSSNAEAVPSDDKPGGRVLDPTTLVSEDVKAVITAIGNRNEARILLEQRKLNLRYVRLPGITLHMSNLSNLDFHDADLSGANLAQSSLEGATLVNVNMSHANLLETNLSRTMPWEADFSQAFLQKADLTRAFLQGANLSGANLALANLSNAMIKSANLSGADFGGKGDGAAVGLTQSQLDEALAEPSDPPQLEGIVDSETGRALVWRGGSLNEKPQVGIVYMP